MALPAFLKLFSRFLVACSPCLPILLRTLLAWSTALTIISITLDIHSPPSSGFHHLSENIAFSFPSPSYSLCRSWKRRRSLFLRQMHIVNRFNKEFYLCWCHIHLRLCKRYPCQVQLDYSLSIITPGESYVLLQHPPL